MGENDQNAKNPAQGAEKGAADADHSGGYVIDAGDPMPCPADAGWGNVTA